MDDFEQELKLGFLEEASQLLTDAEQCFLTLESNPEDKPTLDRIFRVAHNIKGSSKAVGFEDIGAFTHEFESFLLKLKNGELKVRPKVISLLLRCNDHVSQMVNALKEDLGSRMDSSSLLEEIRAASQGALEEDDADHADSSFGEEAPTAEDLALLHAVENSFAETEAPETQTDSLKFEEVAQEISQVEESVSVAESPAEVQPQADQEMTAVDPFAVLEEATQKSLEVSPKIEPTEVKASAEVLKVIPSQAPSAPSAPSSGSGAPKNAPQSEESIRVSLARLEKLINSVGELVILQTVLREQSLGTNPLLLRKTVHQMGKVTKEVQDISMSLRMVPLKQTFQKMQRIVRDTSNMLSKKVNLILQGEETELDKTVLENLSDPLVHLIRNAVDHGVETPEKRAQSGKNEMGTIHLSAYHQSGKLVIEVKDDGGGIDGNRLMAKALEKGILKPGQKLTEQEAIHLIFHPGFSTKTQVTEVSGRGVGMDVVKTNIESLQGEVLVDTVLGKGTTFKVILPLTLAIIDGMTITSDGQRFVVPLSHVHETLRPVKEDVQFATGMGEVLLLRGENLPLYRLSQLLGKKEVKQKPATDYIAMILRTGPQPFGVLVDDVLGQQQVVIKEVGKEIQNLSFMSGSAILGDGKPAIILEMGELVRERGGKVSASAPLKSVS